MITTIQKIPSGWIAWYTGADKVNYYIAHAKTKNDLIIKLIEKVVQREATIETLRAKR